jgi:hypothetical protein
LIVEIVSWLFVLLALAAAAILLVNHDWRFQLGALAIQYLAAFWLITRHLPLSMAAAKLVTGWMVVAALGMTRLSLAEDIEGQHAAVSPYERSFPLILIGIVVIVAAGVTPRIEAAIPGIGLAVIAGAILLIGSGLIQLGITADVFRVTLGLLSMLIGFEIIYAAVESSILVAGLLSITNLGLGLAGSYLLIADSSSSTPGGQERS